MKNLWIVIQEAKTSNPWKHLNLHFLVPVPFNEAWCLKTWGHSDEVKPREKDKPHTFQKYKESTDCRQFPNIMLYIQYNLWLCPKNILTLMHVSMATFH